MSIAEKLKNLDPKKRQYLMLGVLASVIGILAVMSANLMEDSKPLLPEQQSNQQESETNIKTPGSAVDPKEVWMEKSSAQIMEMNKVIADLKQQIADIEKQKQAEEDQPLIPPLPPAPPPSSPQDIEPPNPTSEQVPQISPQAPPQEPGIAIFEVSNNQEQPKEEKEDVSMSYVPAGTFVRVALLGGLDAPTGGQAQSNPHPILMRVQDNAFLPNRFRLEIKECFILASAYGDISSERAIARLETLSCVRDDGSTVDVPVKGYVVGEDGKAGMRGRLVSKQGQVLANALLAGIGSGIGQAFQSSTMIQSVSPLGATSTIKPGQEIKSGVATGIGKALDRLSQYYISLAEKLFPIVEVDAGRIVEVVFTKGFSIKTNQEETGTYTEIWKRGKLIAGEALEDDSFKNVK